MAIDFELNAGQRAWQSKARAFAEDEIRPLALAREAITDPVKIFDWEIIKKGSQPGIRTAVVPKEWGGHGIDHVTQAVVMSELARDACAKRQAGARHHHLDPSRGGFRAAHETRAPPVALNSPG